MGKGTIKSIDPSKDHGIVVENNTGKEYKFNQPELDSLSVGESYAIEFDLLTLDSGDTIASNFKPQRTGAATKITKDTDGNYTGVITDSVTKAEYSFKSVFAKNKVPHEGATVNFEITKIAECKAFAINVTA